MATIVDPNGKISSVQVTPFAPGVLGGAVNTRASTNVVPTIAAEYFLTPNFSVETICCLTSHHVKLTGAGNGLPVVKNALILPATVTVKAHAQVGPFKPYLGVGPSLFLFLKTKGDVGGALLGVPRADIKNTLGVAFQGGLDVPLNDQGLSLSLDAKKYILRPTVQLKTATGITAVQLKDKLDPLVLSIGFAYRF